MITVILSVVQVILLLDFFYFNIFKLSPWQAFSVLELFVFLHWLRRYIITVMEVEMKARQQLAFEAFEKRRVQMASVPLDKATKTTKLF